MTFKVIAAAGGAMAIAGCTTNALPADANFGPWQGDPFLISEMTCGDLLTLRENAANNTYTMLYGYIAGQKQQSLQKRSVVERVTLAAIEECQNDIYKTALDAFEENWEVGT